MVMSLSLLGLGAAVEKFEVLLGEDGVDPVVDRVDVRGEGRARRIERRGVVELDRGLVVLDGGAPLVELVLLPLAAVGRAPGGAVGGALALELLVADRRLDAGHVQVELRPARHPGAAEPERAHVDGRLEGVGRALACPGMRLLPSPPGFAGSSE